MLLELNDNVINSTGLNDHELRIELAVRLYEDGKITVGQGGMMTGLGHVKFQHELGKRQIPWQFDIEDLHADLETLKSVFGDRSK
jgi:predicted HTH domain antitoxin